MSDSQEPEEGAEEKQPKANIARFTVPSISVIKEAERISSRTDAASLFKHTKTQPQVNNVSTPHKGVRSTKDLPPAAATVVEKVKVKTFVKNPHIHTIDVRSVTTQSTAGASSTSEDMVGKVGELPKDGTAPRKPCNPRAILVNIVQVTI